MRLEVVDDANLGEKIRQLYERFLHPFPLDDVGKLESVNAEQWQYLHMGLDLYFAKVAGYASRADRLHRKPTAVLVEAREKLSKAFFEQNPHLAVYRNSITREDTPHLFEDMELVEAMRNELLGLLAELLAAR